MEVPMTVSDKLESIQTFYSQPGVMSDAGEYLALLQALPEEVPALVNILQGLLLHVFWAERYGVQLSEERKQEVQIRSVRHKLERLFAIDPRPLNEARAPEQRLVGNCRDFSLLLAAMLQSKGVPARARCGFGTYFSPGHYEDHWMTEYWHAAEWRWVQVDGQLDTLQQEVLGIQFDPLDMPPGQFVTGGLAWQMCRRDEANPDDFGIFDMHGWDFVKNDLLLDVRALNKLELLPWDVCGLAAVPLEKCTPEQLALLDRAAALSLGGNETYAELRALYAENNGFDVPPEWLPG
jgi:hypothetical protein